MLRLLRHSGTVSLKKYPTTNTLNGPQLQLFKSVESLGNTKKLSPQILPICIRFYTTKEVCPPPQPEKKKRGFLFKVGIIAFVGGATLAYAKYDPEFRKTLTTYVPYSDELIKTVFFEDSEALQSVRKTMDSISDFFQKFWATETKKEPKPQILEKPKKYVAPEAVTPNLKISRTKDREDEVRLEKKSKDKQEPDVTIVGDLKHSEEACDENLAKLEENVRTSATEAINAYNQAIYILRRYNNDIAYIIDEAVNQVKPEIWTSVKNKTRSKNECIQKAREKAELATKEINKMKSLISKPNFNISSESKNTLVMQIAKVQHDIDDARNRLDQELKESKITEKYWDKVEMARKHFTEELEILFPTIDFRQKKFKISDEDLDLFVLHTYANVLFYQKELAKMETLIQEKIRTSCDAAKKMGGDFLTDAQICEALEQEKRKLALCFQKECLRIKKDSENHLREQLKRQSQAFTDHLNDAVKTREMEIERCLAKKFDELIENERIKFKTQLAAIVGRLRGLDQALTNKLSADEQSRRAQVLWSACQALLRSIRAGCPGMSWKEQLRSLAPEINAVKNAAGTKDELVSAVLDSIPPEATTRGVYPEDALRERFLKVEKVARTVALIPEDGAALPIHILSYIQSCLLIKAASPIPQSELNDEVTDFSKLSVNEILQRARYWLDRGDLAQTLKYMNLLQGAPRCVARQWMNETRIYLEMQQAANTLMAHAASNGLTFL